MSDAHVAEEPENTYIPNGFALPDHDALIVALPPVDVAVTPATMDIVRFDSGIGGVAATFDDIVVVYDVEEEVRFIVLVYIVVVEDIVLDVEVV